VQSSSQITTNKPTSSFLQAGCPSCRPTNSVKALNGKYHIPFHNHNHNHSLLPEYKLWPSRHHQPFLSQLLSLMIMRPPACCPSAWRQLATIAGLVPHNNIRMVLSDDTASRWWSVRQFIPLTSTAWLEGFSDAVHQCQLMPWCTVTPAYIPCCHEATMLFEHHADSADYLHTLSVWDLDANFMTTALTVWLAVYP